MFVIKLDDQMQKFHEEKLTLKFTITCEQTINGELCGVAMFKRHYSMWQLQYYVPFTNGVINGDIEVYKKCVVVHPDDNYKLRGIISVEYNKITSVKRLNSISGKWEQKSPDYKCNDTINLKEVIFSNKFYI